MSLADEAARERHYVDNAFPVFGNALQVLEMCGFTPEQGVDAMATFVASWRANAAIEKVLEREADQ